ncbi:hypothetical protein RCO28_12455 [Streptomyces sp. LHD-70]|uniref:hypothetical protein n=1 Tax=Streptomyces sp. LHD-70 TaxID=3072140 RepID=UPI00280D903F|nr:hypothetical protein [Streptomyces sp. LHD-70]MDQ8703293.1 hypothetical protein [Streptomyces sp. LHD-70]
MALEDMLAGLKVGDYVTASGQDTRGHDVTRTATFLGRPKPVTPQRGGRKVKGVRLYVGAEGTDLDERSTWVMLTDDFGSVEKATPTWQNSELRNVPGVRIQNPNVRIYFGGKGGKRSSEPAEPVVLAGIRHIGEGRYEIYDVDSGDVLLTGTLSAQLWWLHAKAVASEPDSEPLSEPAATVVEDLGQPVRHVVTGDLVGYLTPDRFTPIDQVKEQ